MFLIIGTKFVTWGSEMTTEPFRCSQCQTYAPFKQKTGMNFISLFFVVPVIPISGKKQLIECPNCKARYNLN